MAERAPRQARSMLSSNRMLDVAEEILAKKGPDFMTVEAVVAGSRSSTGSFYARFESRAGLLQALHDRFINRVGAEISNYLTSRTARDDFVEDLSNFLRSLLEIVDRHRNGFVLFVAQNSFNEAMRSDSLKVMTLARVEFNSIVERHFALNHKSSFEKNRIQSWRIVYGLYLQYVLYSTEFVTGESSNLEELCAMTSLSVRSLMES